MTDDEALAEYDNRPALCSRFFKFHRANPLVFRLIRERADEIMATGRTRYSIRIIIESIRWEVDRNTPVVKATKSDVFKINSNYFPMYVRLLICRYSRFDGLFELRAAYGHGRFSEEEQFRRGAAGLEDDDI